LNRSFDPNERFRTAIITQPRFSAITRRAWTPRISPDPGDQRNGGIFFPIAETQVELFRARGQVRSDSSQALYDYLQRDHHLRISA
jgi:hypothetical protein